MIAAPLCRDGGDRVVLAIARSEALIEQSQEEASEITRRNCEIGSAHDARHLRRG